MKTKVLYSGCLFLLFLINVYSQQGKVDSGFNTYDDGLLGDGFDGTVRTTAIQSDGKLLVGGDFLNFNGAATPYLCRLLADGSKDTNFNIGATLNGKVYCSLLLPNGKIMVGGSFTLCNGTAANRLLRLNSDGTLDTSFNSTIAFSSGIVYDLTLQSDGAVIAVGSFTKYNGITCNRIVRILTNGNLDTTLVAGSGASSLVEEVHLQQDGKILIGGSFTLFNSVVCGKMVRLNSNGSVDSSFNIGTGFDDNIAALTTQADGKILVGGEFLNFNGLSANKIVRLNVDGTVDTTFLSGSGFNGGVVEVITVNSAGTILAGGSFSGSYDGSDVNRVLCLGANGIKIPTFDIGLGPATGSILTIVEENLGFILGGSFSVFDSQNQGRLARIDAFGAMDISYLTAGVGFDNSVLKILSLQDGKALAFGSFTKFNGGYASRIARLLQDGSTDLTFSAVGLGANSTVKTAVIQSNDKIVFAGAFTSYNGIPQSRIARILNNGALDTTFITGTGFNNQVYCLALQPDGKILVAGNFTSYNGVLVNRIVRLLPDGQLDIGFNVGSGADGIIETILLQSDGNIVLGGQFLSFNGVSANRMIRLSNNGSVDSSFSIGSGFDKTIYIIALQLDDKLIVGGAFLSFNGSPGKRLLRLNADGSIDTSFNMGTGFSNGEVRDVALQPDNRLLIAGTFSGTFNGVSSKRMIRLLPNGLYDATFSVSLNSSLYSVSFTPNNKVLIGGNFNSVSGVTKHRIARIKLCTNSTVWDGTSWSNGFPSSEKSLFFNNDYNFSGSVNSCSCLISSGKTVVIGSGNTLGLEFDYSGSGRLILENNDALYQSEDGVINTGIVQLKRSSTPILRSDYTYWSSPVAGQLLGDVSPDSPVDRLYSFNAVSDSWFSEGASTIMEVGKGYIIRGPKNFSESVLSQYEAVFTGVPNNGVVSMPIAGANTSNLIGNPYPSAINADLFLDKNKSSIDGTIYFWTHNTAITNYVYNSGDYAVYNYLGGVSTRAAGNIGVNTNKPDGKIASGQSFFVTGINGVGNAIFDNSMRIIGQNSKFFRVQKKGAEGISAPEKHRLWLDLSNSNGAFKQILVGYASNATNGFDHSYDGLNINGNEFLNFYSINDDKNWVIQSRGMPFDENDEIPLGYTSTIEGNFEISLDQVDGLLSSRKIYLADKAKNSIHDLKQGPYTFETAKGTFNTRFVLRYTDKTLGIDEIDEKTNQVSVSVKDKFIKVDSGAAFIDTIFVYTISGTIVYEKQKVDATAFSIFSLPVAEQVLLVKTVLQNGAISTTKIVY